MFLLDFPRPLNPEHPKVQGFGYSGTPAGKPEWGLPVFWILYEGRTQQSTQRQHARLVVKGPEDPEKSSKERCTVGRLRR